MAFLWDKDEEGYAGTGSLLEYLSFGTDFDINTILPSTAEGFYKDTLARFNERDQHLARLQLELFAKAGCKATDQIRAECPDAEGIAKFNLKGVKFAEGWHLLMIQPDDPVLCLYFNGKPKAAYYASFRGIYNADGWVEDTQESFRAKDYGDTIPHNTWVKVNGVLSIPYNMLHFGSLFDPSEYPESVSEDKTGN